MRKQGSLTEGNVVSTMLTFAVPFLLANLLQACYGAADLLIIGQFSDAANLSAVSTGSQIMQMVISIVSGLTTGGTVLIGRYTGAKEHKEVSETIGTMFTLFGIFAAVMTAAVILLMDPIVSVMQTPQEAYSATKQYVLICICGTLFIFGYNAISAILRGMGDSKNPLIFIAIACVLNIACDLILVGPFQMGAAGAAFATAGSQGVSMIIAILYLRRKKFIFDFKLKSFRIHRAKAKNLIKIGLPISLQESLVMLSFLFIIAIVNSMGVVASAAIGITQKIDTFTLLPPSAFSAAIAAMAAQNMGAGLPDRAKKCMHTGIWFSLAFGVLFFALMQLAPQAAMRVFTQDSGVILAGAGYLRSFSFDCILVCFVFCMNGFFNGCGHTTFTMFNNLLPTFLVRIPAAYLLSRIAGATLFEIGFAAPLASVVSVVFGFIYLKSGRWKQNSLS